MRRQRVDRSSYRIGLGASTRENAGAFAFSIMITSAFGVVSSLDPARPRPWEMFLFGAGGVAGFALIAVAGQVLAGPENEAQRTRVVLIASLLSVFSVLGGIGAAALVSWLVTGWVAWLVAPFAAAGVFLLVNGIEYALAELEDAV